MNSLKSPRDEPALGTGGDASGRELPLLVRAEGTGLEPAETSHLSTCQCDTCEEGCNPCAALALHFRRSNCPFLAPVDPELLNVIEAWDSLPEHLKKTIGQLVSLAGTSRPQTT